MPYAKPTKSTNAARPAVARGYIDAILETNGLKRFEGEWDDLTETHFDEATLRKIVVDCKDFLSIAIAVGGGKTSLLETIDHRDLGYGFLLARQGGGAAFDKGDIAETLARDLEAVADTFGMIEVATGDDKRIRFPAGNDERDEGSPGKSGLTTFQQGCADALFHDLGKGNGTNEWKRTGREDFSDVALAMIVADCERFLNAVIEKNLRTSLLWEVGDYGLGWHLYHERQGTDAGFEDLETARRFRRLHIPAARKLGKITVEVGPDRKINISNPALSAEMAKDELVQAAMEDMPLGYIDAILELKGFSTVEHGDDLTDDFDEATLRKIVEDCAKFLSIATAVGGGKTALVKEIDLCDLGYHFFLARQGGPGFVDQDMDAALAADLDEVATTMGRIEVEIGEDRRIRALAVDDAQTSDAGPSVKTE